MAPFKKQKLTKEATKSAKKHMDTEEVVGNSRPKDLTKEEQKEQKTKTREHKKRKLEEEFEESDSDLDEDGNVQDDSILSSESESDVESEAELESDDDSFPLRKQKKETDNGNNSFASAFNAIIGSKLKAYDRKDPILARNKATQKKLTSEKLEAKARRLIRAEKKEEQDRHRIKNLLPQDPSKVRAALDFERGMKKVAQKGVVRLFNAVLATQVSTSNDLAAEGVSAKHSDIANEITKLTFLDLVKAAGQE